MLTCLLKEENSLSLEDKRQLKELLVPLFSFSYHFSQSYHKNHTLYYSSKPTWRILLYQRKELVGSLSIVVRRINQPFSLVIGGVGNVGINKSHQGKGLALFMLKKANEFMKDQKVNINLIFCTENKKDLYIKAGYHQLEKPVTFYTKGELTEESLALFVPISLGAKQVNYIQHNGLHIGRGTW